MRTLNIPIPKAKSMVPGHESLFWCLPTCVVATRLRVSNRRRARKINPKGIHGTARRQRRNRIRLGDRLLLARDSHHRPRFADRPLGRAQADCCRIRLAALGSLPCLFDDDDRHRRRRHPDGLVDGQARCFPARAVRRRDDRDRRPGRQPV